jgi:hypothetical protein
MQLFPKKEPFAAHRYRALPSFNIMGEAVNEIHNNPTLNAQLFSGELSVEKMFEYWAYWGLRDEQGKQFESWDTFNGPLHFNNDSFTLGSRYKASLLTISDTYQAAL